jgi:hypothetical protein
MGGGKPAEKEEEEQYKREGVGHTGVEKVEGSLDLDSLFLGDVGHGAVVVVDAVV